MKSMSLTLRAALSLLLMFSFYTIAILMAGGLLFIPYAEWNYGNGIHIKLAFFCVIGAGIILWSIFPRVYKFVPPGPELKKEDHPKLFEIIESVAEKTGQKMPSAVYLEFEVNAWVSEVGGFMGFNKRRIMGVGLPLLQVLNISEIEAVIAHEFGHYYGGDTKLSPIIYSTRSSIGRTLNGLGQYSSLLQKPFEWYGNLFLRVSHAISRNQEYVADRLAAEIVGAKSFVTGLQKVKGTSLAYDYFWHNEVTPLLDFGYKPPLADGFSKYVGAEPIAKFINEQVEVEEEHDPYSTHPPISERIKAISNINISDINVKSESAITLLNNVEKLEEELFLISFGDKVKSLKNIDWNSLKIDVYKEKWSEYIDSYKEELQAITVKEIYQNLTDENSTLLSKILQTRVSVEEAKSIAESVIGMALILKLNKEGWEFEKTPGNPISMTKNSETIKPFKVIRDIVAETIKEDEWNETINKLEIDKLVLL